MNEPRGIRNNNPLNIRLSSDKWQGQINGKGNIDGNSSLSSERAGGEAVFSDSVVFLLFRLNLLEIDGVAGCFYLEAWLTSKRTQT